MSTITPIPIILVGQTTRVGNGVIMALKPDYEGIFPFAFTPSLPHPH